ncbi:MAG: Hsp20/alpha crystallin family protein [Anderseniella sp.]
MVEKSHTAGWWPSVYEPLRQIGEKVADWFAPRSEASVLDDYYEINVELPGVRAEDVDVTMQDGSLVVSGEKRSERQQTGQSFYFSEREYGAFQRAFRLPPDADIDNIDGRFDDGVLCLKIGKRSPSKPPAKKIQIRKS